MTSVSAQLAVAAARCPDATALIDQGAAYSYATLESQVETSARAFVALGLPKLARVAIYLDKCLECVVTLLGAWRAGLIAVPINPKLKSNQVDYILSDCDAALLVTTPFRSRELERQCGRATALIVVDSQRGSTPPASAGVQLWSQLGEIAKRSTGSLHCTIDADPAALMYTSGSTGMPKGVVLSHRNLMAGSESVNAYLMTDERDVILALLPLSFDAGLSQLTTSIAAGATLVLHNYLRPQDVAATCERYAVTCITAVPPLWMQVAAVGWSDLARARIRLFANTGGHMPRRLLQELRGLFPAASPYLMYGLTEAFRSTYLDPAQIDARPDSIGKAIPNCEILVLRPDGTQCDDGEPGELVHRGAHVAMGYWRDSERTRQRFRPFGPSVADCGPPELAVWSGDTVRRDQDGYLYYIGRADEQIKVSGYRVSPTEVESALLEHPEVAEAVAFGVTDPQLGQSIVAMVVLRTTQCGASDVEDFCRGRLPSYMAPTVMVRPELMRSPNGKFDRQAMRDLLNQMPSPQAA